jgi:putative endonuclease
MQDKSHHATHCIHPELPSTKSPSSKTWWVYLLACRNGHTYAGVALDVQARFQLHVQGKGAKYTRANRPVSILGMQSFATKSAALKAEHALKQLEKKDKLLWAKQYASPPDPQIE